MTLVSIPLMDKTGRRTLHLYGLGGMFIFSIFITISFLIKASIGFQDLDVFILGSRENFYRRFELRIKNLLILFYEKKKLGEDSCIQSDENDRKPFYCVINSD